MPKLLSTDQVNRVLATLSSEYPNPRTALRHNNPFELLIATILSAQSTDRQVNKATRSLFAKFRTAADFLELSAEGLQDYIKAVGLFRSKARHILATCRKLVDDFAGEVPQTRKELMQLPGVGRKTANVVLANAFGTPAFAVDTHVFRVANRLGIIDANSVLEAERQLTDRIPRHLWRDAHHWLIYHGRRVCHARNPECEACILRGSCLRKDCESQ